MKNSRSQKWIQLSAFMPRGIALNLLQTGFKNEDKKCNGFENEG